MLRLVHVVHQKVSRIGVSPGNVRRDVQGLRALAVLAVILNHTFAFPMGGFLGVDIFFVISGFIITSMLLRQVERRGRISFIDFYRRRIKRIFPISTLVLVVTVGCAFFLFGSKRFHNVMLDALASFFFVGNWRFAVVETDYWADDGTTSPLQHYWSLGVEEQFYLVWPTVIILLIAIAALLRLKPRVAVAIETILLLAVGLWWGWVESTANGGWAYFSTLARAWELMLGALVAVAAPLLTLLPRTTRPILAWLGIIGVVASLFVIGPGDGMPVPAALLTAVATALVIAASTGTDSPLDRELWPLTNRAANYVGDISFSLYLWHFPVIIFLAPYFDTEGRRYPTVVFVLTFILSIVSYHLVEDPIRRSKWLEPSSPRKVRIAGAALSSLTAACVAVAAVFAFIPAINESPAVAATQDVGNAYSTQDELTAALDLAIAADEWPALSPSAEDVGELGSIKENEGNACTDTTATDPDRCWFPNEGATKTAVLLGDSTAIALLPVVRAALGDDWNVQGLTKSACPQINVQMENLDDNEMDRCNEHRDRALALVADREPDLVIVSTMYGYIWNLDSGLHPLKGGGFDWSFATSELVNKLQKSSDQVVVVSSPPLGTALAECATGSPDGCLAKDTDIYQAVRTAERAGARDAGGKYIDLSPWFCSNGLCPSFVGTTPVKQDQIHLTNQYAAELSILMREGLLE